MCRIINLNTGQIRSKREKIDEIYEEIDFIMSHNRIDTLSEEESYILDELYDELNQLMQ